MRLKCLNCYLVIALFITVYQTAFANKYVHKKDSLEQILKNYTSDDKSKVDLIISICNAYVNWNYLDSSFFNYAQNATSLAKKLQYNVGIANGFMQKSRYYMSLRDTTNALRILNQAKSIYTQLHNPEGIINCLLRIGYIRLESYKFKESINIYNEALEIASKYKLDNYQSITYRELGYVFYKLLDFPQALNFYQKALKIANQAQLKNELIQIYFKIGEVYFHLDKLDVTKDYSNKIIELAKEINDQYILATAIAWQGNMNRSGNKNEIIEIFSKSIEIRKKINNEVGIAADYANLAACYQTYGDFKNALKYHNLCKEIVNKTGNKYVEMLHYKDKGYLITIAPDSILRFIGIDPKMRYKIALEYENKALHIAKLLNDSPQKVYINNFILNIHLNSGDFKSAFYTLQEMMSVKDSLSGQEVKAQIARQEANQFFEQKEAEIKQQNTKFRFYIGIFILFLIILTCIGFGLYYISKLKYQKRQIILEYEKEKTAHELAQAQAEIKSFLKNIVDKNTIIQSVSDELEHMKQNPNFPMKIIASQLVDLKSKIILTNDDWLDFLKSFNRLYPQFTATIKQKEPSITASELRYLMFIKIGMDHKEMASTLGISPDAVRVTWNRTRNKLNGTIEDTPYSLLEKLGVV